MRKSIKIEERDFPANSGQIRYALIYSRRRKTMMIQIKDLFLPEDKGSLVRVLVPNFVKEDQIQAFLKENEHWIVRQIDRAQKTNLVRQRKEFAEGAEFLFLGRKYPIAVEEHDQAQGLIDFDGKKWTVHLLPSPGAEEIRSQIKEKMLDWYRQQAVEILGGRVFYYSRMMGVEPFNIGIRTQKRIWGSCHYRKKFIYLNWKIVLAPLPVVDYVVVHELSHLKVPDHSKKFWRKVEEVLPGYREQKKWLRLNQSDMELPS